MDEEKLERILEIVEAVSKQQNSIAVQTAVMDERMKNISEKVDKIDEAIFGNGKPGLRAELDRLEPRIQLLEKQRNEVEEERRAETDEARKFRYGLYALFVGTVVDIALRLLKVI